MELVNTTNDQSGREYHTKISNGCYEKTHWVTNTKAMKFELCNA